MLTALTAKEHLATFTSGHSLPCLMRCTDLEEKDHEVVVKFRSTVHGNRNGLVCEAMASLLAADLRLQAPQPFIVTFDPDLETAELDASLRQNIQDSAGLNFGTLRLPPQYSVVPTAPQLPHNLYDPAAQILAFDFLIGNVDRHREKPNCLMCDNHIAPLDHELAFSDARGTYLPKPWEFGGAPFIQNHVFFHHLKGQLPDLQPIREQMKQLPKDHFALYLYELPDDWAQTTVARAIVRHLEQVRNDIDKYIDTLMHIMR